jgi:hypothetical protein
MKIKKNTFTTLVLELCILAIYYFANSRKLKIQKIQKSTSPTPHAVSWEYPFESNFRTLDFLEGGNSYKTSLLRQVNYKYNFLYFLYLYFTVLVSGSLKDFERGEVPSSEFELKQPLVTSLHNSPPFTLPDQLIVSFLVYLIFYHISRIF